MSFWSKIHLWVCAHCKGEKERHAEFIPLPCVRRWDQEIKKKRQATKATRTEKRRWFLSDDISFYPIPILGKKGRKRIIQGAPSCCVCPFVADRKKGCGIMVFYCFYCLPLLSVSVHHGPTAWPFLFDAKKRINLRRPIVLFVVVKKRDDKTYFNMRLPQPGRTRYISTGRPMRDA